MEYLLKAPVLLTWAWGKNAGLLPKQLDFIALSGDVGDNDDDDSTTPGLPRPTLQKLKMVVTLKEEEIRSVRIL